ncbi:precorrin-4 C(11)-methyltransferase [Magnetospirillum fulvum]|jgi:precorrin-4/cobalt-precorrin-4 C11-methyltransferase|uniref:Precorrin-4 methylase n=1 Tax=Magnetospirillum fulvum MGU-K5 TaxID=1316936 RepID=S9TLM8_MAGFU|nr:precorrin-4 C(11)-methyltransferase [Magnetospirillum fulvum]EPY03186.1 precorrin-4 methylase [Magnetospirillum fulvum MGU-K5]
MKVHFIGAGPGAPDLITVRGLNLIRRCKVVLYAGSLVPREVIAEAPADARIVDTALMELDQIAAEFSAARDAGLDVARLHSGDLSIYSAIGEQMRCLDDLGIEYDVTPGVPAFAAAAAALATELTLPGISQSLVLTRTTGRATPMPDGETLATMGASGATLAIHLSVHNIAHVVAELTPRYGADCPVVVAFRVGWPDQRLVRGCLADIEGKVAESGVTRTALILVGRVLGAKDFKDSCLYSRGHGRTAEQLA